MCDTYLGKCQECERRIPIHIGNFALEREDVLAYCPKHLPSQNVLLETLVKDEDLEEEWEEKTRDYVYLQLQKGETFGFQYKKQPKGEDIRWIHLNVGQDTEIRIVGNLVLAKQERRKMKEYWFCLVGPIERASRPERADFPMRVAVERAFQVNLLNGSLQVEG